MRSLVYLKNEKDVEIVKNYQARHGNYGVKRNEFTSPRLLCASV